MPTTWVARLVALRSRRSYRIDGVPGRAGAVFPASVFYAVSEFDGFADETRRVMVQWGGVAVTLLAALVGLLALHPLSSISAGPETHPVAATAFADVPSLTPMVAASGDDAHTAGCPVSPADSHAAPAVQVRHDEHGPSSAAVVVPALDRSPPSGPSPAAEPVPETSVLAGARLLIELGISRT
jgi:hypothetical protein